MINFFIFKSMELSTARLKTLFDVNIFQCHQKLPEILVIQNLFCIHPQQPPLI